MNPYRNQDYQQPGCPPWTVGEYEELRSAVEILAGRYCRRVWWLELDEMISRGWEIACRARIGYYSLPKEKQYAGVRGYVWTAVARSLSQHIWKLSSPVSAGAGHAERMEGIYRAALDEESQRGFDGSVRPPPTPHEVHEAVQIDDAVRGIVGRLATGPGRKKVPLALPVLLDGVPAEEVAAREGVEVELVRYQVQVVKRRAWCDPELQDIASAVLGHPRSGGDYRVTCISVQTGDEVDCDYPLGREFKKHADARSVAVCMESAYYARDPDAPELEFIVEERRKRGVVR